MQPDRLVTTVTLAAAAALLAGCAAAQLQLRSVPEGAILVENGTGKRIQAPVDVPYILTNENRDPDGCLKVRGYRAIWASGAQAASPEIIRLCGPGPIWSWKFDRPQDVPNLATDIAVHNQIVAIRQRNAEMTAALLSSLAQGMAGKRRYAVPPPIPDSGRSPDVNPNTYALPQLAPDGTFVSGGRPVTLCPNGQYVAGNCVLTPNGTFVGQ